MSEHVTYRRADSSTVRQQHRKAKLLCIHAGRRLLHLSYSRYLVRTVMNHYAQLVLPELTDGSVRSCKSHPQTLRFLGLVLSQDSFCHHRDTSLPFVTSSLSSSHS